MDWNEPLPDYVPLRRLAGEGGREFVRARCVRTGQPVLLRHADAPAEAALEREAALMAALMAALAPGRDLLPRWIGGALLVMEDPGGELLSLRLAHGPRLPLHAVLAIAADLARALDALHGRGLVHRSLRPEAVYVAADDRHAWIIDLGEASPDGLPPAAAPATPERLAYWAPEQTGRLGTVVDTRADLYALGVLLYELLTGAPPFRSADALELIHAHVAGRPKAPHEGHPAVPPALSALVLKLLAKAPDDRYQTAAGLARDLEHCAQAWAAGAAIEPFALGRHDRRGRLAFAPRLYGRDAEAARLRAALQALAQGPAGVRVVLVEGFAGIGKTALIRHAFGTPAAPDGSLASGKFDQVARGVPFGALVQAFQGLVRRRLGQSEERLSAWRERVLQALGVNGGVLAEVIPEIEFVIGPQSPPVALGGLEAQNRFQRVLRQFVGALADDTGPLVLFLDDLQWADPATLQVLEPLLTEPAGGRLLLVGALRSGAAQSSPQLARLLGRLESAAVPVEHLSLAPLSADDLVPWLADSLHAPAAEVRPLAVLLHARTGGNPFFAMQFLQLLQSIGLLAFDAAAGGWRWQVDRIAQAPLPADVVELMIGRIQTLPPKTQYALTLAACIGNRFDVDTLALVSEQDRANAHDDLERAVAEGLLLPPGPADGGRHAFLHDRVQQAAYALIPAERRQMVHLAIGRLLRERAQAAGAPEALLFDVTHHLNIGRDCVHDAAERLAIARLDLAAGRRAKAATAHETALELFRAGLELAGDADPALAFELALDAAECEHLCGRVEAALQATEVLLARTREPLNRARVLRLRCVQLESRERFADSLAGAREGLAPLGVVLPENAADVEAALAAEIRTIERLRDGRPVQALEHLPPMQDPTTRVVATILTDVWSAAYIVGQGSLSRLISATLVRLSLTHGNVEESAYGYVTHAITVALQGDLRHADAWGRLALAVNRRFDDTRRRAKVLQQFHAHVNFWCQPYETCLPYARQACTAGLDGGDFLYAAYAAGTEPWAAVACTPHLERFERDYTPAVALIERLKNAGFADGVRLLLQWARALQGKTRAPLSLSDAAFDEDDWQRRYETNPFFAGIAAVMRLQMAVLLGDAAQVAAAAADSAARVVHLPGTVWPLLHEFWHGMALARQASPGSAALAALEAAAAAAAARAPVCEANHRGPALLLAAEVARVHGDTAQARQALEDAIEFTDQPAHRPLRALAHERLAALLGDTGRPALAQPHWRAARDTYAAWGAWTKARMLEAVHGLEPAAAPAAPPVPAPPAVAPDGLDWHSLAKATQAIGEQTELPALVDRLLHIVAENAGAERAALVLEAGTEAGAPRVYTRSGPRDGQALDQAARPDGVATGVVHFVRRTGEAVILARAEADELHGADPYVRQHGVRSLACLPLRREGRAVGVLYLEHRQAEAVFTAARLSRLNVLATQAAISITVAQLLTGLRAEVEERRQAERALAAALADVQRLKDQLEAENTYLRRDLVANVSHDLRTPLMAMRGYLERLVMQEGALPAAERQRYLQVALRQSELLGTLVEELFELATLDHPGVRLQSEPFVFAELAGDVLQKFELDARERGVRLAAECNAPQVRVLADLSLVERLLDNLIGNALRHTPAGGVVTLRARAGDGPLAVELADSGEGIAPEQLPHVFTRFYRATAAGTPGAGLGLAICRRIVELHGGQIQAASEPGRGTCFSFSLPLAP